MHRIYSYVQASPLRWSPRSGQPAAVQFRGGILLLLLLFQITACNSIPIRSTAWAEPVTATGVGNFYKVNDKLYRSAQPSRSDFMMLADLGIARVLNLRYYKSDSQKTEGTALTLHQVKIRTRETSADDIIQALRIIKASEQPVLVHCWFGSDRTGVVIAAYRMVFENWSRSEAINEMKNGGYGYHSFLYPNLTRLLMELDIEQVRREVQT